MVAMNSFVPTVMKNDSFFTTSVTVAMVTQTYLIASRRAPRSPRVVCLMSSKLFSSFSQVCNDNSNNNNNIKNLMQTETLHKKQHFQVGQIPHSSGLNCLHSFSVQTQLIILITYSHKLLIFAFNCIAVIKNDTVNSATKYR